jgi:hypothetical protein
MEFTDSGLTHRDILASRLRENKDRTHVKRPQCSMDRVVSFPIILLNTFSFGGHPEL